jgi:hypothetical protein
MNQHGFDRTLAQDEARGLAQGVTKGTTEGIFLVRHMCITSLATLECDCLFLPVNFMARSLLSCDLKSEQHVEGNTAGIEVQM